MNSAGVYGRVLFDLLAGIRKEDGEEGGEVEVVGGGTLSKSARKKKD